MEHGTKSTARAALGLSLAALVLVGAGCATKANLGASVNAPGTEVNANGSAEANEYGNAGRPGMMPAKKLQATLAAIGGSGQKGNVEINEEAGKTVVILTVVGEPKGASEPAHIHIGSCPNPGAPKWPLTPVVDGKSTTTIDASMDDLLAAGAISVNVHKSAADIGTYMACGDLHLPSDQPNGVMLKTDGQGGADVDTRGINANVNADVNANVNGGAKGGVNLDLNAGATAGAGTASTVTIKLSAQRFSYSPSEVHVKLGQKVRLLVDDVDVPHGFSMPAFNVNEKLAVGQTTEIDFTADQAGTFPFFCNTFCGSGHLGMKGTLIVE